MIEPRPTSRMQRLIRRIVRRRTKAAFPEPKETTAGGIGGDLWSTLAAPFVQLSTQRLDVYRDVEEMDATVDEVSVPLDILSDNAVTSEGGAQRSFSIVYEAGSSVPQGVQDLITDTLVRTRWYEKAFGIARDTLKYGDNFLQFVVGQNRSVLRLMWMPPDTMIRNEDRQGVLLTGHEKERIWAFTQVHPDTRILIAGFYPWQIEHLRWGRSGGSKYGRSIAATARTAWRKLQAMEEALVINWLTRAFARLLFILDVTGMSEKEAVAHIRKFQSDLQTRKIAKGVEGVEKLSVVKDIFMGRSFHELGGRVQKGLADVKVLDTSNTGFTNLGAIQYYRGKILMSMKVPKAYLGLEEDINAKATLTQQDRRFARTVRRIQSMLSEAISHTIDLQLVLHDIDPATIPYLIMWPPTALGDEVDASAALVNYAKADEMFLQMGVVTPEYVALKHLRIPRTEWAQIEKEGSHALDDSEERD